MSTIEIRQDLVQVELVQEVITETEVFVEVSVVVQEVQNVQVIVDAGIGLPGKSAYQIALDNGFTGSEIQWLESIGGQAAYLGKTLIREAGALVQVSLYEDAEKTVLARTLHLIRVLGVLSAVEIRDPVGVLVQTKTLQRDAQGVLIGVAYG